MTEAGPLRLGVVGAGGFARFLTDAVRDLPEVRPNGDTPSWLPHHARITIDLGGEPAKPYVYAQSVRAAMADLVHCARTGAEPAAGPEQGWAAVVVAAAARRSARQGTDIHLRDLTAPW